MKGEEGDSDRVWQWAGAGAVPGPDQLHAQQAQQVSRGQGQHPWSIVSQCNVAVIYIISINYHYSQVAQPDEYGINLAPNTASSVATQVI